MWNDLNVSVLYMYVCKHLETKFFSQPIQYVCLCNDTSFTEPVNTQFEIVSTLTQQVGVQLECLHIILLEVALVFLIHILQNIS